MDGLPEVGMLAGNLSTNRQDVEHADIYWLFKIL